MNSFQSRLFGGLGGTSEMVTNALFLVLTRRDEVTCPHCSSANVNLRFKHMGEFECKHCRYYWRIL